LSGRPAPRRAEAIRLVAELLAAGPAPASAVRRRVLAAGIAARTIDRAKAEMGVRSRRERRRPDGRWFWELP